MIVTNIDTLNFKAYNAGFRFHIGDAYRQAEYLQKEKAAREVAFPGVDPDGNSGYMVLGIVPKQGFYYRWQTNAD